MTTPAVSIIIAVVDSGPGFETSLRSLARQTLSDYEIIIVEDGSVKPGLKAQIAPRSQHRWVTLPGNLTRSVAYNAGMEIATGRWLAFLDPGEKYAADRLSHLTELADRHSVELCSDMPVSILSDDRAKYSLQWQSLRSKGERELTLEELIASGSVHHHKQGSGSFDLNPIIRRDFIVNNELRFDERLFHGASLALQIDCFRVGSRWWISSKSSYSYGLLDGRSGLAFRDSDVDILSKKLLAATSEQNISGHFEEPPTANLSSRKISIAR